MTSPSNPEALHFRSAFLYQNVDVKEFRSLVPPIKALTKFPKFDNLQNSAREVAIGGMAEWFKAAVLKTAVPERDRGFESYSLRQKLLS